MQGKRRPKNTFGNIWVVTREYEGLAGAGGVKDVSRQLSEALARAGAEVSVIMPLYGFMNPEELGFKPSDVSFDVDMPYVGVERREHVKIWSRRQEATVYLVDAQRYREKRDVYTYTAKDQAENSDFLRGAGHIDYFAMNVLLQKAALGLMIRQSEKPDIIHCHDGHTAMLPAMIREIEGYRHYFRHTGVVVTIHNAGLGYHQEVGDPAFAQTISGLPSRVILASMLNGNFDPFLAASSSAVLNTVSENYARELQETSDDELTGGLGHRLKEEGVTLAGVTNGINPDAYDPTRPESLGLPAAFDPDRGELAGKKKCREECIRLLNNKKGIRLKRTGSLTLKSKQPLFTFIGRLTAQKGVDKMIGALEALMPMDKRFQVLVLGNGSADIEKDLTRLADNKKHTGRICFVNGYDPTLANLIYAAGDFFLLPSQYEPCGISDYIAQLLGNIPIVHHVGGLVKVQDGVTGFAYRDHSSASLMGAMQKALRIFRDQPEKITAIRQSAVQTIHKYYTWDMVVKKYKRLYRDALARLDAPKK